MRDPVVLALHLVLDRTSVPIGARPINKPLLNETTSQLVEFGNATRARDRTAADPTVGLDTEQEADTAADPRVAEMRWIIARRNLAGDLLEIGTTVVVALPNASRTATCSSACCGTGPAPTS